MKFLVSQSFSVRDMSSVPKAGGFEHSKDLFFWKMYAFTLIPWIVSFPSGFIC